MGACDGFTVIMVAIAIFVIVYGLRPPAGDDLGYTPAEDAPAFKDETSAIQTVEPRKGNES